MSDNSPRLDLPYIQPAQAQKHVTHNEALRLLDALVQLTVVAFGAVTPPSLPVEGEIYALGPGANDAWSGRDGDLAMYVDGAWQFHTPQPGWAAVLAGTTEMRIWDGGDWSGLGADSFDNLTGVGINTTADGTNRLAVSSPATLLSHEGDDHRLKVNKATAGDTASLLFQDGWSGRAEIGLAGDDDLHVKVSADGSAWTEALVINAVTGAASFPAGIAGVAGSLSTNRTYYVRGDGYDGNDGLADTAAGAFRTVQHAVDIAAGLYCGPYTVTIRIGPGTFDEGTRLLVPGNGNLRLVLEGAGYDATTISGSAYGIQITGPCEVTLRNLSVSGASVALWARYGARVFLRGTIQIGTGSARMICADNGAYIEVLNCTLLIGATGSAYFLYATAGGYIYLGTGVTVATTAPVSFTATAFANLSATAQVNASQVVWDESAGAISGLRFNANSNGVINTAGGGASYIPGTTAGITATGGQYV
ncbi:DUF2793 domain-containing protein [Sinisalibacter aestuarii]|uniref:DUF2793 domain-containing protein n=1 Tax=Sinisalibacter aestuarii TaxID=2949426 RepID=A0ABQ5LMV9_9RHOB|nr:DUF2793 domain-containing protein [Sinisalibacter aestuarii]GKY86352.1 hypothetical protein STA1M1_02210 [Sinisalibacter aestuarii]